MYKRKSNAREVPTPEPVAPTWEHVVSHTQTSIHGQKTSLSGTPNTAPSTCKRLGYSLHDTPTTIVYPWVTHIPVEQIKIVRGCISDTIPEWYNYLFVYVIKLCIYISYLSRDSRTSLCKQLTTTYSTTKGYPPGKFMRPIAHT